MYTLRIKEVATAKGLNKAQLSRRADLGATTINDLWDGARTDVRMHTLAAIARALGVPIRALFDEAPEVYTRDSKETPTPALV